MSAIVDNKRVGKKYDQRIKLTEQDKIDMVELYAAGQYSQRGLARKFGVSRRAIQFILDPKKLERNKQVREARGGSKQYYDTEKNTKALGKHRKYKKELLEAGKI